MSCGSTWREITTISTLAGVEHRRGPHVGQLAARHRPVVAVAAVDDAPHVAGHRARLALQAERRHVELAAERERDARADAGALHLLHRLRIEDRERGDVLEARRRGSPPSTAMVSMVPPEAQLS